MARTMMMTIPNIQPSFNQPWLEASLFPTGKDIERKRKRTLFRGVFWLCWQDRRTRTRRHRHRGWSRRETSEENFSSRPSHFCLQRRCRPQSRHNQVLLDQCQDPLCEGILRLRLCPLQTAFYDSINVPFFREQNCFTRLSPTLCLFSLLRLMITICCFYSDMGWGEGARFSMGLDCVATKQSW